MSCPICGERCRCAEPRTYVSNAVSFVDVDEYDPSEEQFASSVMSGASSQDEEQELTSGTLASARERYESMQTHPQSDLPLPTRSIGTQILETPVDPQEEWRNEVASRLQSYKARRRKGMGDSNMRLNFESTAGNHVFLQPDPERAAAYAEPEATPNYYAPHACATEPVFEETQAPVIDQPSTETQTAFEDLVEAEPEPQPAHKANQILEKAKLIFFPKPPSDQDLRTDELAEPVFDTPRILDAPEEMESVAIPLADITLNPQEDEDPCVPYVEPIMEFHFMVAPVPQRVFAEILDTLVVLLATGIFGVIVAKLNPAAAIVEKHALVGIFFLVPAIFWSVYKYLFLVHGGRTLGMQMAQLRLVQFDGCDARTISRRFRALSMLVSIFPLGLGLLWAFVDPDALCWHDRISRTYMTSR